MIIFNFNKSINNIIYILFINYILLLFLSYKYLPQYIYIYTDIPTAFRHYDREEYEESPRRREVGNGGRMHHEGYLARED